MPKTRKCDCESGKRELFEERLERIFQVLTDSGHISRKTQVELANALNIRQSSISDAKRRCSIPAEWMLKLVRLVGVSPEWIEEGGDVPRYRVLSDTPEGALSMDQLTARLRRKLETPLTLEQAKDQFFAFFPDAEINISYRQRQ